MPPNTSQQQQAQPSAQLTPFQQRFVSFRKFLRTMEGQLAAALPKHGRAERMIRVVLTEVSKNPDLLECTENSMVGALLHAAQLGLDVGSVLGQAYLIPFRNHGRLEVSLIPGYKGLVKLAYQSGEVGAIRARVVYAKDKFSYGYGLDEYLEHVPYRGADRGPMVAVYAVARIKGVNEAQFVVLERHEVEEIRDKFSKRAKSGPWVDDFEEMAKKSAIRRLCKLLPASVENDALARAVAADERAEAGLAPDYDNAIDIQPVQTDEEKDAEQEGKAEEKKAPANDLDRLADAKRAERGGKKINIQMGEEKQAEQSRDPGDDG